MFAQSLGEYGVLGTLTSKLQVVTSTIGNWVSDAGPGTWLVVGGIAVLVLWLRRTNRREPPRLSGGQR